MIEKGQKIPAYLGTDAYGNKVFADDFAGKALIIYFYPKDNTPGCTAEACSIRDGYEKLREAGYEVIGISKDSGKSHLKFAEKYTLPFILLSDTDTEVNQAFGVWAEKKMAGRTYMGTLRTTFITDKDHTVTDVITKVDTKHAAAQLESIIFKEV